MKKLLLLFVTIATFAYADAFIKESDIYVQDGKVFSLHDDKEITGVMLKEKDGFTYYTTYNQGVKVKEKVLNSSREVVSEYSFDNSGLINGKVMYSDDYGVSKVSSYTKGIVNGYAKAMYYEDLDYEGNFTYGIANGKIKFLDANAVMQDKLASNGKITTTAEKSLFDTYFAKEFIASSSIKLDKGKAYKGTTLFTGLAFTGTDGYITNATFYNNGEKKAYFEFSLGFMTLATIYTNENTYTEYSFTSFSYVQGMLYTVTNFANNVENGYYSTYYEDGWRFEGTFKDGKLFGKGTYYDENNKIREIHDYLNDKYTAVLYFDFEKNIIEGKLQGEKIDGNWVKTGKATYYTKTGKLDEEIEYNGTKGYSKLYYENGKLKKEGSVDSTSNLFAGEVKEYYETGILKSKLTYTDGYLNGKQYYYNEQGKESKVENYDYGTLLDK